MRNYRLLIQAVCYSLILAACAQTRAPDYRNEVGANGLLTPRAVFTRYVDALGGERAIRAHTSTTIHGRFVLTVFGVEGDATIYARAPNHVSQVIELPGLGTIQSGYNGEVGWSVDPLQGSSILQGDALTDLVQQSDYYMPLNLVLSPGQETEELTQSNGTDAYKLKLTDARGKDSYLYFAVDSGLLVQSDVVTSSPAGEVPTTTFLSDYQDFEGYLQPTTITISAAGQEFAIEVDNVAYDDVTDAQFVLPDALR
ncbi:MAG: hypothetical protein QGF90_10090 [Gammaproteobacteria bacterium]|jgi:hypothetical protein|nr:hypothetical protein [Gammaproteobacteria bacterium]